MNNSTDNVTPIEGEIVKEVKSESITQTQPQPSQIVQLAADPQKILAQVRLFEELKGKILSDRDYQEISGKRYIKKSGWRMFALAFNLSDELLKEDRKEYQNGKESYFVWEATVRATAPNGRYSEATASCASNEKRFSHQEHDVRATAHTRAKNRAISDLIGGGEVSAEEVEGVSEVHNSQSETNYPPREEEQATPRQVAFIKKLAEEKDVEKISEVTGIVVPDGELPTKKQASEIIEKLMSL